MVKNFILNFKNVDVKILNAINKTTLLSLITLIISTYILYLYSTYPISFDLLTSSLLIFKASISILVSGFLSGFTINIIKQN